MKARGSSLALVVLFALVFACAATAGEAEWKTLYDAGNAAFSKGDFRGAVDHFSAARREADAFGPEDPRFNTSLFALAHALHRAGRSGEAIPIYQRVLAFRERTRGENHPEVALVLSNLAEIYRAQARYAEAAPLYQRALAVFESHPTQQGNAATAISNLASIHLEQGRYADAEALYRRAIEIGEKMFGREHPVVALRLTNLASLYRIQGRYSAAEPLYQRALQIREKNLGPEHPAVAETLNFLGLFYVAVGRYADAAPLYRRALEIREKVLGPQHPEVAQTVSNLAELHRLEGRYSEAETLLRRALALGEQALGPEHPAVATRLLILAALYGNQGRYAESEQLYRRALAIREKALGAEHSDVAQSLNNLAAFFFGQGRYADAEPLYRRALAIYEKTLGPDHSSFGNSLQNLASVYLEQGRYAQAEPLFVRAVANAEKALGPEHPNLAQRLNSLASLYRLRGRHAQAEPLYRRALAIREKVLGPDHPDVANTLNTLGILNLTQRRYAEAEPQFQRALSIQEKALGAEHPDVGNTLSNLALLYRAQEKNQEVEPLYLRALAIREKTRGPDHPSVSVNLSNLASFYEDQGRVEEALKAVRRVTATLVKRFGGTDGGERRGALGEQRTRSGFFEQHVRLLAALTEKTPQDRINAAAESFTAAQLARASDTAEQVANMAARYAAGSGALASLARARQDALGQLERIDARVLQAMSRPRNARSAGAEAQLREEEKTARAALAELDEQLTREYPAYRELTDPRPLELPAAQKLLAPDEALVLLLIASNLTLRAGERTFLWVLRHDRAEFFNLPVKRAELVDAVKKLRTQLDLGAGDPERILAVPFDVAGAHELYRRILAPAEALLGGARQLIFVPDGPLSSLPPWVLVTDPPARPIASLGEHAQVAWLAKRHAITILPAVSSLRALRQFAKSPVSDEPFRGFGDPLLEGKGPAARGVNISALFSRGSVADVDEVKKLARLPESADELRAIAKALKASPEAVLLGEQATERAVKEGNLARFRTLAFATHGLMAGEFKGLAEPALVLTPPVQGTALDDGLLTASEIAQLRLDADWVVLSACNTAAPDGTPGAEGLSGLARAFFYAGARSLLVSHWAVSSDATVALTTRMFEETAKGAPKAEALRRSMLALMEQSQRPHFAHPAFWAPFVVVGEGNDHWSKAGASGKRQP